MDKRLQKFFLVLVLCVLSSIGRSYAGIEPYENFLKGLIRKGDTVLVKDEKFRNPGYNWGDITNLSVKNTLTLRVIDETQITQNFSCELQLKIEYYSLPGQQAPSVIDTVRLKVNYSRDQGAHYKITDTYKFLNGHQVKVTVMGISSPQYGENLPPVLQLASSILVERQYRFKPENPISPHAEFAGASQGESKGMSTMRLSENSFQNNNTQLKLTWTPQTGAEEYDIEWTTIDHGSEFDGLISQMQSGSTVGDSLLNTLFRNNATRITTHENSYLLSLVYNAGFIAVRMRQVQYQADGIRLEGSWDYELDTDDYALWPLSWHEQNMNWQYSSSFAEDGKKKEVVSYFDGTLRGRQTVSLNNSDQVAVVQENVYDQFGRPAASILPAPVKANPAGEEYLHYIKEFNMNEFNAPYTFSNIKGTGSLIDCGFNPDPLINSSGASNYYSENNQFLTSSGKSYNKFIPKADGYPLSVTQYTPDNTGRIRMQGGVGSMFQPGNTSANKTTKYYYGKPE